MVDEVKYEVEVKMAEKAFRVPKEIVSEIKGIISKKMLSRMKKEYVNCPVEGRQVAFLVCFTCPSFLRRFRGVIQCAGGEGPRE